MKSTYSKAPCKIPHQADYSDVDEVPAHPGAWAGGTVGALAGALIGILADPFTAVAAAAACAVIGATGSSNHEE